MVRCKISQILTRSQFLKPDMTLESVDSLESCECRALDPCCCRRPGGPVSRVNTHQNHKQIVTHVNQFNFKITVRAVDTIVNIYFWQLAARKLLCGTQIWGNWPSHTILWLNSNLGKIPRKSNRPDNWVGTHGRESIWASYRAMSWQVPSSRGAYHWADNRDSMSDRGTIKYLACDKNQKPGKILLSTAWCFLFLWQISQSRGSVGSHELCRLSGFVC